MSTDLNEKSTFLTRAGGFCLSSQATALGRQRRGEAVRSWGSPPGGTAERVSRLEATVVGSADLFAQRLPLGEASGARLLVARASNKLDFTNILLDI
ncbi:hypothetical protein [Cylindrospermum stagnale]|uniref:hypothetical protein n=1 Tax=Cylindrospermum stagnale TaxID=142864 RepID=UPI0012F67703|nr:hypothetical protein [Cylindrospermum stagnale]